MRLKISLRRLDVEYGPSFAGSQSGSRLPTVVDPPVPDSFQHPSEVVQLLHENLSVAIEVVAEECVVLVDPRFAGGVGVTSWDGVIHQFFVGVRVRIVGDMLGKYRFEEQIVELGCESKLDVRDAQKRLFDVLAG